MFNHVASFGLGEEEKRLNVHRNTLVADIVVDDSKSKGHLRMKLSCQVARSSSHSLRLSQLDCHVKSKATL